MQKGREREREEREREKRERERAEREERQRQRAEREERAEGGMDGWMDGGHFTLPLAKEGHLEVKEILGARRMTFSRENL